MQKSLQTLSLGTVASCLHGNDDKPSVSGRNVYMKVITVNSATHGNNKVLVDDDTFDYLNQFTWCVQKCGNHLYATRKFPRTKSIVMHRVVMGVTDPTIFIDHKDGNGLNNQRGNLRIATRSQNLCNRGAVKGSASRFKGVAWVTSHKLWRASITHNKKSFILGYFKNQEDAARAYDVKAKEFHLEFAKLNFP